MTWENSANTESMHFRVHFRLLHEVLGVLKPSSTELVLALCTYMNHEGKCYPTYKTLAEHLNVSTNGVKKRVQNLKEFTDSKGEYLVKITECRGENGRNSSNLYEFNPRYFNIF